MPASIMSPEERAAVKNARRRERYAANPEYRSKVLDRNKSARLSARLRDPDAHNRRSREWAGRNREKSRAIKASWNERNPSYFASYNSQRSGTEKTRSYKREWQAARLRSDPQYRAAQACRTRLLKALRGVGVKAGVTLSLVGCSAAALRAHLESLWMEGMSWDNHTISGWHIDHIRPLASFDLSDPEQQRVAFHYTNLRPLWATDNLRKGARLEVA
jgi:hypothetical protein